MKINALIVDDEYNCRNNLEILLTDFCSNVNIVGQAESAEEARIMLETHQPNLIFLDIAMPEEDGFSFLRSLEKRDFAVIFTTAHNEYALKAFKEHAIDYLEKPINIDELITAVTKVETLIKNSESQDESLNAIIQKALKLNSSAKISIPTRDGYVIVDETEIVHLEASDNYTMIFLTAGRKHLSSKNIKVYEENLDHFRFFRTHKSHIINMKDHLREFSRSNGNVALLTDGKTVPISRRKLSDFIGRINTF
ncbi:MAG: response regulator transcription factor [Crocinitomicaceae bacterium]|nr:response regulator transcription factor [Crocinitomicaceae bacterium]